MDIIVLGLMGLVLGAVMSTHPSGNVIVGAAAGLMLVLILRLFRRSEALTAEVRQIRSELEALRTPSAATSPSVSTIDVAAVDVSTVDVSPADVSPADLPPHREAPAALAAPTSAPPAEVVEPAMPVEPPPRPLTLAQRAARSAEPPPVPAPPSDPSFDQPAAAGPDVFGRALAAARAWLLGGNTVARVGILVLFLGLAFLLRYAGERVSVPIELRYAGVGLASIVLLVIGWRLRERNGTYGLILQGGAVAVMYLTIVAAMHLQRLIPPGPGGALLVAVVVFSAILAIAQDSLVLAAAGAAGGFAAPLLTASGGENHVALFSYLALLNAGILAIAWFKAWRPLNLIGFVGTLGLGMTWGTRSFTPDMFATTEPFLVLLVLMYVAIGLLFARRVLLNAADEPPSLDRIAVVRWAAGHADAIDGTLLFGTPLAGFGLQYAIIRHVEFGTAFSALGVGLFYMALAAVLMRWRQWRYLAVVEIYIALGAIFATLSVPLGLDARWTAAAWAIEGAGVYWVGVRQNRRLARAFALLVQLGAALRYVATLAPGTESSLISGSRLGAVMLGASLLFCYWQLHRMPPERRRDEDRAVLAVLAGAGLGFLYLLAPLSLDSEGTAIAWAVAGLVTMFAGIRLRDRIWVLGAMLVQALGGVVFFTDLSPSPEGQTGAVLGSGFHGLLVAAVIGGMAAAAFAVASRDPDVRADPAVRHGLPLLLLFGLACLNVAVLFVLPWRMASGVWAGTGMFILVIGLKLQQPVSLGFALVLQLIGGGAFLVAALPALPWLAPDDLTPLAHSGFWTPVAIAVAAWVGAWLLFRAERDGVATAHGPAHFGTLSVVLLVWATAWWGFAWSSETFRLLEPPACVHALLLVAAGTVALWLLAARRWQWRALAALCALLTAVSIMALSVLTFGAATDYHPAAHWGAAAWPALFAVHFLVLGVIPGLLPQGWPRILHVLGCWLILAVAALEVRFLLIALSEHLNAWQWLGWAAVPSLYLVVMARSRLPAIWPVSAFPLEYGAIAALPVAVALLAWFWLANVLSDGSAEPLPYVPVLNPLELGQLLVIFSVLLWLRRRLPMLPLADGISPQIPYWLVGASTLFLFTCTVLRTAHHWGGLPWEADVLLASMLVQASLSILWATAALTLMIAGHAWRHRHVWIVGATVIAVVVVKLFLVELLNTGGLPRIVSFIGVGALLLVIGYFAPLPPRAPSRPAPGNAGVTAEGTVP